MSRSAPHAVSLAGPGSGSGSGPDDLGAKVKEILSQLANLAERVSGIEKLVSDSGPQSAPAVSAGDAEEPVSRAAEASAAAAPLSPPSIAVASGISEEELLAVSAAVAAWLGVHAHIRQIRLIRTHAWAQQGRVTIQTSHGLHY